MKIPSVMGSRFAKIPKAEIQRSQFDRSHGYKTTFDAGWLIPFYVDEVLPGDTFNLSATMFARLATPLKPIMDNMFLETFFFFVPNRLVWDNWNKFNGEQTDPGDSTDFLVPTRTLTGPVTPGTIWDYFGLPHAVAGLQVNALHFRAYNLIWNEWFRDQNLQDSLTVDRTDGPDVTAYVLKRRGKRHDYFTSCLPWPQKGDSVTIPLGTSAEIHSPTTAPQVFIDNQGAYTRLTDDDGTPNFVFAAAQGTGGAPNAADAMYADLSTAVGASINELRQAFQIQKLLERDARGGTRYTEIVKSHFGVTSPDARLQRPEYLGGGSTTVNISPVAQTSEATAGSPQANLAAIGTVTASGHGFTKSFTEHGVLLGLMSVRADLTYQNGLHRMWSRQTRYDFYWPALAHIGEQAVLNKEIFYTGTAVPDDDVFGYQERHAEYRFKPSQVTGLFNSQAAGTLDVWHLSQEFSVLPTLGDAFIQDDPPIDRIIAVPTEPHFLFDSYIKLKCARPMPVYGVPGLIDHF